MKKKHKARGRFFVIAITMCQSLGVITVLVAQPPKQLSAATNEKMLVRETEQTNKRERKNEMKGANDFDFLIGEWRVHHRGLKERLANKKEWMEFVCTCPP